MTSDIQRYKDMEKFIALSKNPEWLKTIDNLKNFQFDEKKDYRVTFKQGNQRKNRTVWFDHVQYDEETQIFIFIQYERDFMTQESTSEVQNRFEVKAIEIIEFSISDVMDMYGINTVSPIDFT